MAPSAAAKTFYVFSPREEKRRRRKSSTRTSLPVENVNDDGGNVYSNINPDHDRRRRSSFEIRRNDMTSIPTLPTRRHREAQSSASFHHYDISLLHKTPGMVSSTRNDFEWPKNPFSTQSFARSELIFSHLHLISFLVNYFSS